MMTLSVAIVDHSRIYRRGLCSLLAAQADTPVVYEADTPDTLINGGCRRPAVLLIADDLPRSEPLAAVRTLQQASPPVPALVLSASGCDNAAFVAINAGAAGFVRRDCAEVELLATLRSCAAGRRPIDALVSERPLLAQRLITALRTGGRSPRRARPAALSSRELAVLDAVAAGLSNQDIGALLGISPQTVKNHMTSILSKLAARDRTAAVVTAVQRGWLYLPQTPGR